MYIIKRWGSYNLKTRIVLVLLAMFSFGAGTQLVGSNQAHAASTDTFSGISGKCVDVNGGHAKQKNKVQLYRCNNTASQSWTIPGDGTIQYQGLCLDVAGGNTAPKTHVQLYDCNGTKSQQWTINGNGTVVSALSNLCLDDSNGITKNGNPLWVYSCNATPSQTWSSPTITQEAATEAAAVATQKAAEQQAAQQAANAAAASTPSSGSGYVNSAGNYVQSPSSNPQGATARCKDGTYSYSQSRRGTCSYHGGVEQWL